MKMSHLASEWWTILCKLINRWVYDLKFQIEYLLHNAWNLDYSHDALNYDEEPVCDFMFYMVLFVSFMVTLSLHSFAWSEKIKGLKCPKGNELKEFTVSRHVECEAAPLHSIEFYHLSWSPLTNNKFKCSVINMMG